ncbi:lambda exonuclease family protein [Methylophilus flavus]|uniref:Lambda exonuclease family protein n=1 Tax=Methylophilus flavus TaxID=640084 RepID=A0ABW3P8W0_9PROT
MDDLQRTEQWFKDRLGKFTGSRFVDVMARNKRTGEPLKAYHDLIMDIVVERITGEPIDGPQGFALQWGTDVEPAAREAYELETGMSVVETGFLVHPKFDFVGCSPDGLIDDDGGLEMKCPKASRVHLERFTDGLPEEYKPQVQGCMWVTGRQWWDFVSFDPRMPASHQLLIISIERDDDYIKQLESAVIEAEALVQVRLANILKKAA